MTIDPVGCENHVEQGGELGVPIANEEPQAVGPFAKMHEQIAGLLDHPRSGRVGCDAGDVDLSAGQVDEEQHVDPLEEHRIDGEEVAGQDRLGLSGEEPPPGGPVRRGAGSPPARCGMFHTLPAEIW
jgi:hypothetical protein